MATFSMSGETDTRPQPARQAYKPSTQKTFEPLPDGLIVLCDVVSVEERPRPEWARREGDENEISFRVQVADGEYKNRTLWGSTPVWWNNSPKCKLRNWAQEILAYPGTLEDLNTDDLAGRQVQVIVGNRNGRDKEGNPKVKDYIQDMIRVKNVSPDANEIFG